MQEIKSNVAIFEVSLKKIMAKFLKIEKSAPWFVQHMDHSGIPLYLILYPEEIEPLAGASAVGLEVNLPAGIDAYMGRDDFDRGRKKPKVDIIFKKENTYYIVEVIDRRTVTQKEKEKVEEYARRFKEGIGAPREAQVVPIIVRPKEKGPSSAFAELYGLIKTPSP